MKNEYKFGLEELESQILTLSEKKITELTIVDERVAKNKQLLLRLINLIEKHAQDVFVSFLVDASVIDREVAAAASRIFCSLEITLECTEKGGKILFDRKFYANKSKILNDAGIVFGFDITYAVSVGDTLKSFMERLDFAVQQYPNHIDFPQTEVSYSDIKDKYIESIEPKVTGLFSANDIRYCRDVSFACRTFYSNGRAVPWFLSVLKPLRIHPSSFFADFAEWQRCNNCDYKSGFVPENENHRSIERMQLLFLDEKYEEKHCHNLLTLVNDIVRLNGAMARLAGENEKSTVETSYNPDDIFGPESFDIDSFSENVCMEQCKVNIFFNGEFPDYEVQGNL